jgi:hypothetical protein
VKKPRKHNKHHNVAKATAGNLRPATRSKDVIHRDSSGHAFGIDHSTNALLEIREPPRSLILLREELPKHPDIYAAASKEPDFARCIGTIAAMLDIVLDGQYAGDDLCDLLYRALRNRGKHGTCAPSARPSPGECRDTRDGRQPKTSGSCNAEYCAHS